MLREIAKVEKGEALIVGIRPCEGNTEYTVRMITEKQNMNELIMT